MLRPPPKHPETRRKSFLSFQANNIKVNGTSIQRTTTCIKRGDSPHISINSTKIPKAPRKTARSQKNGTTNNIRTQKVRTGSQPIPSPVYKDNIYLKWPP
eukprot:TRINITY_DN24428_c0_g1_i1.p1 TRINITY_DN24428_c0_g1~~TRINITY_DN24428_c0_g1_i1.p1  ORF type:complete len:100 (-),score=8.89 TRINITY_DN24428_c0_g1_i1:357-656(-)